MKSLLLLALGCLATAETGIDGWLRYAPVPNAPSTLPANIVSLNASSNGPVASAASELQKGLASILSHNASIIYPQSYQLGRTQSSIVIGSLSEYANTFGSPANVPQLTEDGYFLNTTGSAVQILGQNERGALYGAFAYLSMLAQGNFSEVAYASNPSAPIRWVNQWVSDHDSSLRSMR
jgi:alpha-glucuronidase